MASPTTTPLDDNSVGALLSLDQAMETLAARVTPAIVNVTVTSRRKPTWPEATAEDMQQFSPFGAIRCRSAIRPIRPVFRPADAAAAAAR